MSSSFRVICAEVPSITSTSRNRARAFLGAMAAALLPLLGACATTTSTPTSHAYFQEMGELEGPGLSRSVQTVLQDAYGFAILRRDEQYASVYYETRWKDRDPFPDEEAVGITETQSRVIVRGPQTSEGSYRVIFEGENRVRTDSVPEWHTAPITVDFRTWMAEIVADMRDRAGIPD